MAVIKIFERITEWIMAHKFLTGCFVCALFFLPLLITHALFQWDSHVPWLEAKTWDAGDVLSYISGFMTLIGTIVLGAITVYQSKKAQEVNIQLAEQNNQLAEQNNQLQQIMAQNLYPIITMEDAHMTQAETFNQKLTESFWCIERRFCMIHYFGSHGSKNPQEYSFELQINYDSREKYFKYKTTVEFDICNASSSIITNIHFTHIQIWGGAGFSPVDCTNTGSMTDFRTLLRPGDKLKGKITIFFNNKMVKEWWDTPYRGIGMGIDVTNTTIADIKFREHINLEVKLRPGCDTYEYYMNTFSEN